MSNLLRAAVAVLVPLAIMSGCASTVSEEDPAASTVAPEVDQVQTQRDKDGNPSRRDVCLYACWVDAANCQAGCGKLPFCRPACSAGEIDCQQKCPAGL